MVFPIVKLKMYLGSQFASSEITITTIIIIQNELYQFIYRWSAGIVILYILQQPSANSLNRRYSSSFFESLYNFDVNHCGQLFVVGVQHTILQTPFNSYGHWTFLYINVNLLFLCFAIIIEPVFTTTNISCILFSVSQLMCPWNVRLKIL